MKKAKPIHEADWEWFGYPAHFILGYRCVFHMATKVGNYLVSTVGECLKRDSDEDHNKPAAWETLGIGGDYYETYVFRLDDPASRCDAEECGRCGLALPTNWSEIDGQRHKTSGDAARAHIAKCREYARGNK